MYEYGKSHGYRTATTARSVAPTAAGEPVTLSSWSQLEAYCIDRLTREELTESIRAQLWHLPRDLRERIDEQATDALRMLVLAARLLHVLRMMREPPLPSAAADHRGQGETPRSVDETTGSR